MNILASAKHSTLVTKSNDINHPGLYLVKDSNNSSQIEFDLKLEAEFNSDGLVKDIQLENN